MNDELQLEYAKFFQSLGFDARQIAHAMGCLESACYLSRCIEEALKLNEPKYIELICKKCKNILKDRFQFYDPVKGFYCSLCQ